MAYKPTVRGRVPRLTLRALAWVVLNLVVLEAATRVYFAAQVGPRVLFYGTPWHRKSVAPTPVPPEKDPWWWSPQNHRNNVGEYRAYTPGSSAYSKYFPYEKKWTMSPDGREKYPVRINNHGFRGEDFTVEKAPGTLRILTLGASSTFGYHDRDDETYPVLLQRELERTADGATPFEVINFGVPHATTDNILGMFLAEGVSLSPSVVTFYEGANDSAVIEPRNGGTIVGWREALVFRSLLAALLDRVVPRTAAADVEWWWSDELARRRSRAFIANLDRLAAECRSRGIRLVVATQQFKSTLVPDKDMHGLSYDEEVALVREKVARGEIGPHATAVPNMAFESRVNGSDETTMRTFAMVYPPRAMLVHTRLMADLRAWAARTGVRLVDVIHELDGDRDLLVNWVHLRGEGNARIARALAREIRAELSAR